MHACVHVCVHGFAHARACTHHSEPESIVRAPAALGGYMDWEEELTVSWSSRTGELHEGAVAVGGFSPRRVDPRVSCDKSGKEMRSETRSLDLARRWLL